MPSGVELATAWVSVVPTFSGVQAAVTKGFAPVGAIADAEGAKAGNKFTTAASKGLSKLGGVLVAAFAVNKVIDGFNATVKAASDLAEAGNSVSVVFGPAFKDIEKFSQGAAKSLGLSQVAALNAAKTFGIFGQSAGLAGEENVKFSTGMAQLAADLASFHNTTPEEAIIALGAALRGENEPIRRFGILLDDATLRQKALALGLISTTRDALTPQQKVLAAHAAIMEQSGVAQGDFARTSEGLANQQRILNAEWENFSAELGVTFLPMMTNVVSGLNDDLIPALHDMLDTLGEVQKEDWFRGLIDALGEGGELDLVGGGFVDNLKKKWEELPTSLEHGWEQIKQGNVTASAEISKQMEQSAADWGQKLANGREQINTGVRDWWAGLMSQFENGGRQIGDWWQQGWDSLPARLQNGRDQINAGVTWLWEQIVGAFANGWTQITTWWGSLWSNVWTTLNGFIVTITSGVVSFVGGLIANFQNGWNQITAVFRTAGDTINGIVNGVKRTFEDCARGIRSAFDGIGAFIRDAFGPVGDFLGGVAATFNNLFGGIGDRARYFKGRLSALAESRKASSFAGGVALARVQSVLGRFPGLHVTETLGNRAYDVANGVARSPNSYHYDQANPAVDVAGPIPQLHAFANLLYAMGGWRQILWQVPGHYDHVHVAHSGGMVESSWPRMWGDAADERTARLQVGETVLPRGWEPASVQAWEPPDRKRRDSDEWRSRAAVEIKGDVYTTDIDEFFDQAERQRRRAYALAAPAV